MHLFVALGLMMAIPALIALLQEGDKSVKLFGSISIVVGLLIAAWHPTAKYGGHIPFGTFGFWLLGGAALVFGIIMLIKLKNKINGTLIAAAGVLFAAYAFKIIQPGL